jgi:hypothetical protein
VIVFFIRFHSTDNFTVRLSKRSRYYSACAKNCRFSFAFFAFNNKISRLSKSLTVVSPPFQFLKELAGFYETSCCAFNYKMPGTRNCYVEGTLATFTYRSGHCVVIGLCIK